ncbi:amidase signature domain-containing protein [Nemania abortiva]|nr:amidase signature domain-containing protein [Nemania abortiva]
MRIIWSWLFGPTFLSGFASNVTKSGLMRSLQSSMYSRPHLIGATFQQRPITNRSDLPSSATSIGDTQLRLLQLTAKDLQDGLQNGSWTSEELVNVSLSQIESFDRQGPCIHAMINVAPRAKLLAQTRVLDLERREGKLRGPLHGIPIVLKDIVDTDPYWELPTTQGAKVLQHVKNARQSKLVEKLTNAGLIVIGKTNLSEFGAGKGENGVGGLSALGGQAKSVYVAGGIRKEDKGLANINPGGSSTGSALAVAAGYTPVSIGGEADGSLTTPASRAALYALKCTPQTISSEGIFLTVPTFETIGGMAKSVRDLADITQIILQAAKEPKSLDAEFRKDFKGFTLGFVDPPKWKLPEFLFDPDEAYLAQMKLNIEQAIDRIRDSGGVVHYPIDLIHPSEVKFKGYPGYLKVLSAEVRDSINKYLFKLTETPVRTLKEIIDWNDRHPEDQAGIDQTYFTAAQNDSTTPNELAEAREFVKDTAGNNAIFKIMDEFNLDAICAPTDGPICTLAAMAGCPTACVPLGYLKPSGRPFGLSFIARPGKEDLLLGLMSAWEATSDPRKLPSVLLDFISDGPKLQDA